MRVVHVDLGSEMRGGQWQCLSLIRGLTSIESLLLAPRGSPLLEHARRAGVKAAPFSAIDLWLALRKHDLAHAHDSRSHQWLAALAATPFVVSRRVGFAVDVNPLNRWKYSRAAHYLAVSNYVRRSLLLSRVPDSKISTVYDGVDVPQEVAKGAQIVALETGDPLKGDGLVREAAAAGGFAVSFTQDLLNGIRTADVFLYITHSEGLGSAALIAMAHGVPVVASRVGGLPEIVEDGVTGFLTANDPRSIADAVARARADRERLGANARNHVARNFTSQLMVTRTMAVYQKVAGV